VFEREAHHMYSAMIFSVDSERLRLMRSESKDMVIKKKKITMREYCRRYQKVRLLIG